MILLPDNTWEIRTTEKKGRGFFTTKDIEAGTIIGDYLGEAIRIEDEEKYDTGKDFYLMYYHEKASLHPDLTTIDIHLINHSCSPNAWMYTYRGHVVFFALRHIFKGEELTIDYLLDPLDDTCSPCTHQCNCGSVICTGIMHLTKKRFDAWNVFYDNEVAKTKRERIQFGEYLKPLSSYPENIPDEPIYTLFGATEQPSYILSVTKIPDKKEIRNLIRTYGKILFFPKVNIEILGVREDLIISKNAHV